MTDAFATLIPDAQAFFSRLSENNTKDWWTDHKSQYDTELKAPALLLLDGIAVKLTKDAGRPVATKLFRPHRDVRFSKDKTPYNTHLHMAWSMGDGAPGFFLGISPEYVRVGGGIMGFDKSQLVAWRAAIDAGGPLLEALETVQAAGFAPNDPDLKRVPTPYAKDHPQEAWLRHKGCALWRDLSGDVADLEAQTLHAFRTVLPLNQALISL